MKYVYIELSTDLHNALYQLISAEVISHIQNAPLAINVNCLYKESIFKNYYFNNVECGNSFNEKRQGSYNINIPYYKSTLQLIGEFKDIQLFEHYIDDFIKNLCVNGYEKEIDIWLNEVNMKKSNNKDISVCLYSNKYISNIHHRGGWKYVMQNLFNSKIIDINYSDYSLIDNLDHYCDTEYDELIFKPNQKWFGMVHSTIFVPQHLPITTVSDVINSKFFSNNKKNCIGLITFTSSVKNFLEKQNLNIEVLDIKHPIRTNDISAFFKFHKFKNNDNKQIILLGKQLRKIKTIYLLNCPRFQKIWLPGTSNVGNYTTVLNEELKTIKTKIDTGPSRRDNDGNWTGVSISHYCYIQDYDHAICENIIIVDLWDATANNSVLECLIRNIPFFVPKIESVVEYLGQDYPMYFETLNELENIINGDGIESLYKKTHNYLTMIDKTDISYEYFNKRLGYFFNKQINKVEFILSNIKEHDNWSFIEKYLLSEIQKECFRTKIVFIPFVDIFILNNVRNMSNDDNNEWIGILHNPDVSEVYPENDILKNGKFVYMLKFCKGLFVMSNELKDLIITKFKPDFFVEVLIHPIPHTNISQWDFNSFINNEHKQIIQIGNWLRKTYGIFKINVPSNYKKAITPFKIRTQNELEFWKKKDNVTICDDEYNSVKKYEFIEQSEYNDIFKNNIIFLDLYDSTANNVIMECIKSNCPILINDNANIKEYLGTNYPMYYKNYQDIDILLTQENIRKTHYYLQNMNKETFQVNHFTKHITNTLFKHNFITNPIDTPYKVIFLIIDSDNEPSYDYNRHIWRQYMNTNPDILCMFIKYDNQLQEEVKYIEDLNTLYIKGEEKYECEAIYTKTLIALKYIDANFNYKYVIRTNLSSFWNFENLQEYLNQRQHGKYLMGWLVNNTNDCENPFISGTGIIIPNNLVPLIFDHTKTKYCMDDIEISEFYRSQQIDIMCARRKLHNFVCIFEFNSKGKIDDKFELMKDQKIVYYRVKSYENREENDKYCLDKLLKKCYNL